MSFEEPRYVFFLFRREFMTTSLCSSLYCSPDIYIKRAFGGRKLFAIKSVVRKNFSCALYTHGAENFNDRSQLNFNRYTQHIETRKKKKSKRWKFNNAPLRQSTSRLVMSIIIFVQVTAPQRKTRTTCSTASLSCPYTRSFAHLRLHHVVLSFSFSQIVSLSPRVIQTVKSKK